MLQNNKKPVAPATPQMMGADYPEQLKNKGREFFKKGAEVAYTLNYDYAIELYLDGLSFWPNALEEGHKLLWDIARRRQVAGGKKSGFGDGSKYKKASTKHPKDAMLKAEYLLCKDPSNQDHMMDMAKSAFDCQCRETALWMLDILFDNNLHQPKPNFKTYIFLKDMYVKAEVFPRALHACQLAAQLKPKDDDLQDEIRNLSAQATMQQGRYDDDSVDFRESIKDRENQSKLHDEDKSVRSASVLEEAIEKARLEYEADPLVPGKIDKYVTTLCGTEKDESEMKAVQVLEKAYQDTDQFQFKKRAGDIRIKNMVRKVRKLQAIAKKDTTNKDAVKNYNTGVKKMLLLELDHYKACVANYPSDMLLKYEYGRRLMQAGKYDDAIPLFQEARSDPRHRLKSINSIGSCFFYKKWYADAIESFEEAFELVDNKEGPVAKELLYNLGRANEAADNMDKALEFYRQVARIDFNYQDARNRVDAIRKALEEKKNG